ncbi:MAG TPA: hypothetical protein VK084_07490, partial [Chitinophagaceae bacterium]|nr:hypothetical protein [Chitinophagaceae bacterium]
MKKLSILTVLFILLFIMACNNTSTKHENNALTFAWAIQGQIPDSSIGLAGPVTGISNDVLIVGGGSNFPNAAPWDGGAKKFYNEVYVFKQEKDSLVPLKKKFSLPYKVAYSANCSIDAGIVIAGGQNIDGALNNVSLLHWDENTRELQIDTLPNLPFPLSSGALAARGNQLYFAGGQNENEVS